MPGLICPECGVPRKGRYCNQGHKMRRCFPPTEEELEALRMAYPPHARHVRRTQGPAKAASLLALAAALSVSGHSAEVLAPMGPPKPRRKTQ